MRTNHSAATRAHRVSRALSSTKNPMNSAEPRNHDRILWLGLLALLLSAACGTSANPGPGTPDPIRTYRIRRLADSPVARNGHVAIGLADGSALVMGGNSSEAINLPDSSSTQRFDPPTEAFTAGPMLALSALDREFTVPVPLRAGAFLLVGGGINSGTVLATHPAALSQRFDPVRGEFVRSGDLKRVRSGDAAATLLADGRVLVTGGGSLAAPFSETYDPATEQWTIGENLLVGRRGHTGTLLADGRVLVAGGFVCCTGNGQIFTDAAEIYDPTTGTFQLTAPLRQARGFHRATLLADGRVLLSGGFGAAGAPDFEALAASEIFDPVTEKFSSVGGLQVGRAGHSALLLPDGRVLAVGGTRGGAQAASGISETELFDAPTGKWTAGPRLDPAWVGVTATLLGNGKVLLFGGEDPQGFPRPDVILFE